MDLVQAILMVAIVVLGIVCFCYACCFSPPCQKIADAVFEDDPLSYEYRKEYGVEDEEMDRKTNRKN
jgi:hypothetical protein